MRAPSRALALAYVVGNRTADALPLLAQHLTPHPTDQAALLAGIYATYVTHAGGANPASLATDRTRAQAWAKAYAASGGSVQSLSQAWMKHLDGLK